MEKGKGGNQMSEVLNVEEFPDDRTVDVVHYDGPPSLDYVALIDAHEQLLPPTYFLYYEEVHLANPWQTGNRPIIREVVEAHVPLLPGATVDSNSRHQLGHPL